MYVLDEVKDYSRHESMTFVDLLEALGRVAEMKCIPPVLDMREFGYQNAFEWAVDKERKGEEGVKTSEIFK